MTGAADAEVLVVGETLIDIVEQATRTTEFVGGSPANVALGVGRLGVRVALLTQVAADRRGRMIADHLSGSGVRLLPGSTSASRTSTATATIATDGRAQYTFDLRWEALDDPVVTHPRVIHTGSIAAFMEPGASSVRRILEASAADEVTFDPNIRPALLDRQTAAPRFEDAVRLASVVKMSDEDADYLYPGAASDDVMDRVLTLGARLAVITRGARGAVLATRDRRVEVAAEPVDPVDTIGAGDTFMASLIVSILELGSADLGERELIAMGERAAHSAAITVGRAGADLPWAQELDSRRK